MSESKNISRLPRKKEILIFSLIVIVCLLVWLFLYRKQSKKEYGSIKITARNRDYGTYSLAEDQEIAIYDTNVCVIEDGSCYMKEADCPDHLCMEFDPIGENNSAGLIVCLPNDVVIEGIPAEGEEPAVDAATQ